jgi:hypothetical protein
MLLLMLRSALFAFVGLAFFVYWVVADPTHEESADQSERSSVLAFSGVILLLAFAVPTLARLVGGRLAFRVSLVAAAGATLSSVANIFEDGLQMSWVFLVFILCEAFMQLGLVALTGVIAFSGGRYRLLALAPAGTIAGIHPLRGCRRTHHACVLAHRSRARSRASNQHDRAGRARSVLDGYADCQAGVPCRGDERRRRTSGRRQRD